MNLKIVLELENVVTRKCEESKREIFVSCTMECEKELIVFGKNDNDEERKEIGREGQRKNKDEEGRR